MPIRRSQHVYRSWIVELNWALWVGTVPTQIDYADYREVAGVRLPYRTTVTWTDGQSTVVLSEVRPNVAIDAARFARPAPFTRR